MKVHSCAYRTDLEMIRHDGQVLERDGYLVARSPNNPGYYWGNFLLFPRAPRADDVAPWLATFQRELGHRPEIAHIAVGWDIAGPELGGVARFARAGFEVHSEVVMEIDAAPPPITGPTIRPLCSEADWEAMTALNRKSDSLEQRDPIYARFKRALRARYRSMVEAGIGAYLGAFIDEVLVGQLGLFRFGELARFQAVETHPDHRGRGICTALVAYACAYGFDRGARRLVLVAADGSQAERIYRRLGFAEIDRQWGVHRPPPTS